jgi:hypothetical protein
VVGSSAWGAGRRLRLVPVLLALAGAGTAGFLFAQWASRRAPAVPSADPLPSVPPRTAPPATYAAPYVPPLAAGPSTTAPARTSAAPLEGTARAAERPAVAPSAPAALAPTPAPPEFTLQAVTQQDGRPVAIVNGQLVRVGDVLQGARILRIEAEEVEIEVDGRRIVLGF